MLRRTVKGTEERKNGTRKKEKENVYVTLVCPSKTLFDGKRLSQHNNDFFLHHHLLSWLCKQTKCSRAIRRAKIEDTTTTTITTIQPVHLFF